MQTTPSKPLILIDGSSYLYRAFHALPALTNSLGEPTGAIYGVLNMIRKLLADYDPDYIAVIFDAKGKTFRHDLYEPYKAHRPSMPEELRSQLTVLKQAIQAMGLPLLAIEGIEADDVIASLATAAAKQGWTTLISTSDKDMAQLVNEQISLVDTMSNTTLDRQGVMQKFGVTPEQIIDYLALIGDSSDNIPGIAKVGPKTAAKWLHDHQSLANIIANAEQFTGKIGENLRASLEFLPLARQLVQLRCDEELPYSLTQLHKSPPNNAELITLFQRLEFRSWLKELLEQQSPPPSTTDYLIIDNEDACNDYFEQLQQVESIAIYCEISELHSTSPKLLGIALSHADNQAVYIPLGHNALLMPAQLNEAMVLKKISRLLNDSEKKIIGHNVKQLVSLLAKYDIPIRSPLYDSMLESYLLDSTSSRHELADLSLKYLGKNMRSLADILGKAKQLPHSEIAIESFAPYAAEKADTIWQLHQLFWPKFLNHPALEKILTTIEIPLASVLSHIENHGVLVDGEKLARQSEEITARLLELENKAYQLAGQVFNLASPKQLQEILYLKLKLPILEKTPSGAPSTAESVLQELSFNYPLPTVILEHRGLSKLKSTYTDSLPKQINARTGRIHTHYNQAITSTGRLSSTDPNLQNIPIRDEQGRRIRQAFIAAPGYKIISADYSQIELRIMAHLSQDPGLLKAFAEDIDIHTATSAEVMGISNDQVTPEQRRHAKAVNFGLIYGMSSFGLSRQLGISREVAQLYMDNYFNKYPGVKLYMEATRALARQQGFVETLLGRRLYVADINSSQMMRRRAAERAAINAPMQGTAADIIKIAMINLDQIFAEQHLNAAMIMQVHDELVFEVAEKELETCQEVIREAMVNAFTLSVPLAIHIGVGDNWDEAH